MIELWCNNYDNSSKRILEKGLLTDEEFAAMKRKLIEGD